jgi:hypothetical protein
MLGNRFRRRGISGRQAGPARPSSSWRAQAHRARPRVEWLEARVLPHTFVVTSPDDTDTPGTLRYEIEQSNQIPPDPMNLIQIDVTGVFIQSRLPTLTASVEIQGNSGVDGGRTTEIQPGFAIPEPGQPLPVCQIFSIAGNGTLYLLDRLILRGGTANNSLLEGGTNGGAINSWGILTLRDCTVTGCSATGNGGAIYQTLAPLTLERVTIGPGPGTPGNRAGNDGGGIYFQSQGGQNLTISSCFVMDNVAGNNGGGIYYWALGSLVITGSSIGANTATAGYGGGIAATCYILDIPDNDFGPPHNVEDPAPGPETGTMISSNFAGTDAGGIAVYATYYANINADMFGNACGNPNGHPAGVILLAPGASFYLGPYAQPGPGNWYIGILVGTVPWQQ